MQHTDNNIIHCSHRERKYSILTTTLLTVRISNSTSYLSWQGELNRVPIRLYYLQTFCICICIAPCISFELSLPMCPIIKSKEKEKENKWWLSHLASHDTHHYPQTIGGRECSVLTSTQYQLHSELVEGSSWAEGPDENLTLMYSRSMMII